MADGKRPTLEERLAIVEAELKHAKEWRRQATRAFFLGVGCVAALLVVVAQTVPASGGPSKVTAPFIVVDSHGKKIFDVTEGSGGGVGHFYTLTEHPIAGIGALNADEPGGFVYVKDPLQRFSAQMSSSLTVGTGFVIYHGGTPDATLAEDSSARGPYLHLDNQKGVGAELQLDNEIGKLELTDAAANIRVEAGTLPDGDGTVEVSGPTGKCYPGFVGLPCQIVGR